MYVLRVRFRDMFFWVCTLVIFIMHRYDTPHHATHCNKHYNTGIYMSCSGGMSYNTNVLFVHVYVTIKLDLNTRHMLVIVTSVVPSSTALSSPSTSTHH